VLLIAGPWLSDSALGLLSTAARRAGVRLAVLNLERFVPSRRLIREQLESGRLGAPGVVRMHRWDHSTSSGDEMPASLILDVDVALWLVGETPDRVYAVEVQHEGRVGASGRLIQLHLGFPGGGMALIDYAERPRAVDGYQSLSVIGSSGAAYADDHQNMQLLFGNAGPPHAIRVSERAIALVALVQSFVNELDQPDAERADSSAAWTRVLGVALAARQSVASGRAVAAGDAR
jgi:predicted dehydrogenase